MAIANISSSDLKEQALPNDRFDIHTGEPDCDTAASAHGASGYRFRLAFLFGMAFVLWGAIYAMARLIFNA